MKSPYKRLIAAMLFALPAASLALSPAMAEGEQKPKTTQHSQTKKHKSHKTTHAKAKKKPATQAAG